MTTTLHLSDDEVGYLLALLERDEHTAPDWTMRRELVGRLTQTVGYVALTVNIYPGADATPRDVDKWATALEDVARSASLAAIDYGAWCWQLDRDRRASDSGGEAA